MCLDARLHIQTSLKEKGNLMAGMLQILTYMLAFYMVLKGVEILQIALASGRERRTGIIIFGALVLAACVVAALAFVGWQDTQATSLSHAMGNF